MHYGLRRRVSLCEGLDGNDRGGISRLAVLARNDRLLALAGNSLRGGSGDLPRAHVISPLDAASGAVGQETHRAQH